MGCLKNIIKIIILALAIVGFNAIGGLDALKGKFNFNFFEKPSQEKLVEKASSIANLSDINDEFQITKTANLLGFKTVMAEHKGTSQKMIIADTGKKSVLTKKDFETKEIDTKLKDLASKMQYQFIRVEDLKITQRGTINTMGQNAPYVKFKADTVNLPFPEVQGIIGVVSGENDQNKIILSINDGSKYSQIIAQEFFRDVK